MQLAKRWIVWPLFNLKSHFYTEIHADLVYSHTRCGVISCSWSAFIEVWKTVENAASDGFGSNLSGVTFYQAQPIDGFLLYFPRRGPPHTKNQLPSTLGWFRHTHTYTRVHTIPSQRELYTARAVKTAFGVSVKIGVTQYIRLWVAKALYDVAYW